MPVNHYGYIRVNNLVSGFKTWVSVNHDPVFTCVTVAVTCVHVSCVIMMFKTLVDHSPMFTWCVPVVYVCTGQLCETFQGSCASDPCLHGGVCLMSGSGYTCVCSPPYTGNQQCLLIRREEKETVWYHFSIKQCFNIHLYQTLFHNPFFGLPQKILKRYIYINPHIHIYAYAPPTHTTNAHTLQTRTHTRQEVHY